MHYIHIYSLLYICILYKIEIEIYICLNQNIQYIFMNLMTFDHV